MMKILQSIILASCCFVFAGLLIPGESSATLSETEQNASQGQSGYETLPEFGGPESVSAQLKQADEERETLYKFDGLQRTLAPYFDWKRRINEENGVALGFQFYALYQKSSSSLAGRDDDAAGNIFRFLGNWQVFESGNGNLGRIEWRLESRSDMFGLQAPGSLGGATGIATVAPGFGYSENFDLDLSVINWTQGFASGKAGFAVGRLDFAAYLDAFPFQTFSKGFINRSFVLNPTLSTTGIGAIGGVVKGFASNNIWLGAQMYDANAISGDFNFDTVQEGEWLKAVEIGYTPSLGQRNTQLVQFTYWEKDARALAGTTKGRGWAVSAAYELGNSIFPFARFGHSDGGAGVAAEDAVSLGAQIKTKFDQVWTLGAGWARPSVQTYTPGLDNETVVETSYKLQLSKNFSLTPDIQIIFNPANDPDENFVWIAGIRMILTA
jgi:porin